MILVAESGMERSMARRSSPAVNERPPADIDSGATAARAVMNAIRSRIWTMPTGSSSVSL